MRRIKKVLQTQYIGAVMVGFLAAQLVMSVVSMIVQPLAWYLTVKERTRGSLELMDLPFPWSTLIVPLVTAVLYLVVVYLLLRWLYLRAEETAGSEPRTRAASGAR